MEKYKSWVHPTRQNPSPSMELYKRSHPYKPRRNQHRDKSHSYSSSKTRSMEVETPSPSTMENLNYYLPETGSHSSQFDQHHHHRLHCPGLLECDHCSNSNSSSFGMKTPNRRADDEAFKTTSLINDDGNFGCGCENLNFNSIRMHNSSRSSSPDRGKHLDFGCECGETNYKDNDNGVKTLANCCDTLGGRPMEEEDEGISLTQVVQVHLRRRCATITKTLSTTLTRWKNGLSSCVHRGITLFSGRPPLPFRRTSSSVLNTQWTRMTSFLYTFAIVLITCLPNIPVSYACSSRSTPKPRPPSPTLRPNITIQTYTCPPEYDAHYCLNGATCFTVKIGESILYNCECAEGYMGQRCEFKDLDGSYLPSKQRAMLEQAGVSGAVAIVIILVVVVLGYAYVRQSRRKSLARHARDAGDQVDGFVFERRPFSQYYYNNPSISISQDLHRQSRSARSGGGNLDKVNFPMQVPVPSISVPSSHQGHSSQRSPGHSPQHQASSGSPVVPLHSAKKSKPPDPPKRQT